MKKIKRSFGGLNRPVGSRAYSFDAQDQQKSSCELEKIIIYQTYSTLLHKMKGPFATCENTPYKSL